MDTTGSAVPESKICDPESRSAIRTGLRARLNPGLPAFHPGMRFKLLSLVTGVSLFSVLISAFLLFDFQRRQLINNAQSATNAVSNTIEANLQHAMLTDDWAMVNDVIQAAVAEKIINRLRILDNQGGVGASSVSGEVGTRLRQEEGVCQSCHTESTPPSNKTIVISTQSGQQVLLNVNLIENQPECQSCHSPENKILGLLVMEIPLTSLNDQLNAGFWRTMLFALATFVLLTGLMVPALNRYVIRPVDELGKGVAEISAGNLDFPVQVAQSDELGSLAGSFDAMRRQLKISLTEMKRREQELGILNEVSLAASQLLDLQEILDFSLAIMVNTLGMESGMIYLCDESENRFTLRASHGISKTQIEEIDRRRRSGWDITRKVAETGKEVFVADMAQDIRFQGVWEDLQGRSYVSLPLISRGTVVGVMGLITPGGHSINKQTVTFFQAVAREIGIAIDNAMLLAGTQQREQAAIALYDLGTKISASLALSEVLEAVAKAARELLAADASLVGLLDEGSQEVIVKAVAGTHSEALRGMHIPVGEQTPGEVLVAGQPVIVETYNPDQPLLNAKEWNANERFTSFLAVPLKRGESFLGLVEVLTCQRRRFLPREAQLLLRLAQTVVVSIENARLYRQLRHLSVLEERDRLAREMHDHLAQGLGYLNVKASITNDQLSSGRVDLAQESLLELKKVAQLVYTDTREAIFNLRTAVSAPIGLLPTLQDYLAEYRAHYGVEARLEIDDEDLVEFMPEVANQLLCIIQEALTNVRKHAGASRVWIRCKQDAGQVCVHIEDDGRGFYLAQVAEEGQQRFGLQIMRERAESVGGSLEIDSQPGRGTHVLIRIPLNFQE